MVPWRGIARDNPLFIKAVFWILRTIDDDGLVMFESVPICLYTAIKYAPETSYIDTTEQEAAVLQWSFWAIIELEKYCETASLHVTWFSEEKRDSDIAKQAQGEVSRCLDILEKAIADNSFLVAKRFTLVDLIISEVLTSITHTGVEFQSFPLVKQYLENNLSQASAKKALAPDIIQPYRS